MDNRKRELSSDDSNNLSYLFSGDDTSKERINPNGNQITQQTIQSSQSKAKNPTARISTARIVAEP